MKIMNESNIHAADTSGQTGRLGGRKCDENKLGKSKAVSFTRAQMNDPLNQFFGDQKIMEASRCKYLGIILCSNLNWADKVNYCTQLQRYVTLRCSQARTARTTELPPTHRRDAQHHRPSLINHGDTYN